MKEFLINSQERSYPKLLDDYSHFFHKLLGLAGPSDKKSNSILKNNNNNPVVYVGQDAADKYPVLSPYSLKISDMPLIKLKNRYETTTPVITQSMAEMIRPFIPKRYQIASVWSLLYSLDQHGASLKTMYEKTGNYENPCILAIRDSDDQIFGCYSSQSFSCQTGYYGTGECFLWKSQPKLKVYPWTGKNDYMILTDSNSIAMGGGDGRFGLWLTSDLEKGYSNSCQTFDNDHLSLDTDFKCLELEVWGLCI